MFDLNNIDNEEPLTEEEEFWMKIDQYLGNLGNIMDDKSLDPEYFVTPWAQFYV